MRILGIDVGSSSLKAIELDSAFGRYEIHDYYEQKVMTGEEVPRAIERLIGSLHRQPDKISISLRAGQVTFRNLKLPTRDRKTIQASIGFELEDDLPFPMEKTVYDYSTVSQGKQGTQIHVAATMKEHVLSTISAWSAAGVNPDMITTESWAYRTLLSRVLSRPEQESPVLLAQIGHLKTTLYVHWNGMPVLARELDWGGRDLTQAIAQRYNLPMEQAEQAKLDHGFVVPLGQKSDVTPEQQEFSETLLAALQTLIVEIRQIELTCKSLTHQSITQIFMAGGTVLLPGLNRVIEDGVRVPTKTLHALSSIATSGVTYSEHTDATFLLAASVALCLVGNDRASTIDFRKGEFAKIGAKKELNFEMLGKPALAAGTVIACMILSLMVQSSTYKKQKEDVDNQLEKSMKQFFGSISGSAVRTYLSNPTSLKNSINKELTKQRNLAQLSAVNPHDPLDYLNTISMAVPKMIVTDLMQYQVGAAPSSNYAPDAPQTLSLNFTVMSFQSVSQLETTLSSKISGLQKKVEEGKADDGTKIWRVTFTGKPNYTK